MSKKINNIACYKVIRTIKKRKNRTDKGGGRVRWFAFHNRMVTEKKTFEKKS